MNEKMINRIKQFFLVGVLILAPAIAFAQEVPDFIYSHTVLKLPYEFKVDEPWSRVITTQEEWEKFYLQLIDENAGDTTITFVTPKIDFNTYQVITGSIGFRSSGGYSVSVEKIHELNDAVAIDVIVTKPGSNCVVPAMVTYPSTAILIKKTTKPIRFYSSQFTLECDGDVTIATN